MPFATAPLFSSGTTPPSFYEVGFASLHSINSARRSPGARCPDPAYPQHHIIAAPTTCRVPPQSNRLTPDSRFPIPDSRLPPPEPQNMHQYTPLKITPGKNPNSHPWPSVRICGSPRRGVPSQLRPFVIRRRSSEQSESSVDNPSWRPATPSILIANFHLCVSSRHSSPTLPQTQIFTRANNPRAHSRKQTTSNAGQKQPFQRRKKTKEGQWKTLQDAIRAQNHPKTPSQSPRPPHRQPASRPPPPTTLTTYPTSPILYLTPYQTHPTIP